MIKPDTNKLGAFEQSLQPIDMKLFQWAIEVSCSSKTAGVDNYDTKNHCTQGHCKFVSIIVNEFTGLDIYTGTLANGKPHWWNGFEHSNGFIQVSDLTSAQFMCGERPPIGVVKVVRSDLVHGLADWEIPKLNLLRAKVTQNYYAQTH